MFLAHFPGFASDIQIRGDTRCRRFVLASAEFRRSEDLSAPVALGPPPSLGRGIIQLDRNGTLVLAERDRLPRPSMN